MSRRPAFAIALLVSAAAIGCTSVEQWLGAEPGAEDRFVKKRVPYAPDRRDYFAFRAAHPEILEPNYLPFMLHRGEAVDARGDPLILCRWPEEAMPLPVFIDLPELPESLQDEFHPVEAAAFAAAVERALATWEAELEGLVRFRRVDRVADARLRLRLLGERAPSPNPEIVVLGATEALIGACRVRAPDPASADRVFVDFEVPELVVYLADEFGLLTLRQVERIALHEIGHALGMLGHSPIARDLMVGGYRDEPGPAGLAPEDRNSFVSLYRLPNGTVYAYASPDGAPPPPSPDPPPGEPRLALAPVVDPTLGFQLRLPYGWMHVEAERGVFAANGPVWSFDASLEVVVSRQPDLASFLQRSGAALFDGAWLRRRVDASIAGAPGLLVELESPGGRQAEWIWLVRAPGERGTVVMLLARVPIEAEHAWRPWIEASLETFRWF